jgi:hypothetical protein
MSKQYLISVTPLWCVEMIDADQTHSEKNVGGFGLYIEVVRPLVHVSVPPPFPTPIILEYVLCGIYLQGQIQLCPMHATRVSENEIWLF